MEEVIQGSLERSEVSILSTVNPLTMKMPNPLPPPPLQFCLSKPSVFRMLILCGFFTALSRLLYAGRDLHLRSFHPSQILSKADWDAVLLLQGLSKSPLCCTVSMPCMWRGLRRGYSITVFKQGCGLSCALQSWAVILLPIFSPHSASMFGKTYSYLGYYLLDSLISYSS